MAGRGRGRGRGFTFDIGSIGFGKGGEALPAATLQPPPHFPPLEKRPLPLRISEDDDYMLGLKEQFKLFMNSSPYYVKPDVEKKDIERYSDRYKEKAKDESVMTWKPDWNYIPSELKIKVKSAKSKHAFKPKMKGRKKSLGTSGIDFKQLEELAEKEGAVEKQTQESKTTEEGKGGAGGGGGGSDDDDVIDEDDYDEQEQEEENDYLVSHFDDDDDVADDDDMDEGPIY